MPMQDYEIVGSYNNQRVSSIDSERSVNLFEYTDPLGKKPKSLLSTSGLINTNIVFSGNTGGVRAQFIFDDNLFIVVGNIIYRFDSTLSITNTQIINTNSGHVGIDANTFQVIFVDGTDGWIWDNNQQLFTQITDSNFPDQAVDACYLDGFFVVAVGESANFQLSSLFQGMVWGSDTETIISTNTVADTINIANTNNFQTGVPITFTGAGIMAPLNITDTFYSRRIDANNIQIAITYDNAIAGTVVDLTGAEVGDVSVVGELQEGSITSHPGTIVGCRTLHRRLFLFSQNYTEVWENAGAGTNLPFRRNNSLLMEYGTPALGSISVGFDRLFFLAQDKDGLGAVMQVLGTQPVQVSNRALDFQFAQYAADPDTGVSDAVGFLMKENGLIFYRLNFTAANHTYVYSIDSDLQNPKWHEEELLNGDRHPAQNHAYFNGLNYVGHYNESTIYIVSANHSTNDGQPIKRMRIGRPFSPPSYQRIRVDRFHLDLLQGRVERNEDILDLLSEVSAEILTELEDNIILESSTFSTGEQPEVFLSISRDGGQSYGNRIRSFMGKIGQRTYRTVWRKLGTTPRGQAFVPRIEFFNEVPFIILGAAWSIEVLPE